MREIGKLKKVKTDLINALKVDKTLARHGFYYSWLDVKPTGKKPCHSIDFDVDTEDMDGCGGGLSDDYTTSGFIITYLDPNIKKGLPDQLDEHLERVRNALKTAHRLDTFTVVTSFTYKKAYRKPWAYRDKSGEVHIVAHRIITEFELSYKVNETT